MEVDINALSTEVLWKLHHFTKSILQNIRKKPGQKPADVPGGASQPEAAPATGDNAKQPNGSGGQGRQGSSSSSSSGENSAEVCFATCAEYWPGPGLLPRDFS